jgi:hypothetical protein
MSNPEVRSAEDAARTENPREVEFPEGTTALAGDGRSS